MQPRLSWGEARETVIVLLLAATSALLLQGLVRALNARSSQEFRIWLNVGLSPVDVVMGLLVLLSAILVATAEPGSLPDGLSRAVLTVSTLVLGLAAVSALNGLTLPDAGSWSRLEVALGRGIPAGFLAGGARWLTAARNHEPPA